MGEDGFSIEEAYRVVSKGGPIETYKRDVNKVSSIIFVCSISLPNTCDF
jgi:hypothetical protein